MDERIKPGSVVQISPAAKVNDLLHGMLAIVDEGGVRDWGCVVTVVVPEGGYPCRVESACLAYVGELTWKPVSL